MKVFGILTLSGLASMVIAVPMPQRAGAVDVADYDLRNDWKAEDKTKRAVDVANYDLRNDWKAEEK